MQQQGPGKSRSKMAAECRDDTVMIMTMQQDPGKLYQRRPQILEYYRGNPPYFLWGILLTNLTFLLILVMWAIFGLHPGLFWIALGSCLRGGPASHQIGANLCAYLYFYSSWGPCQPSNWANLCAYLYFYSSEGPCNNPLQFGYEISMHPLILIRHLCRLCSPILLTSDLPTVKLFNNITA